MKAELTRRYVAFFSIAVIGCAVDLLTKSWVFNRLGMPGATRNVEWLWQGYFGLETSLNEGALFGLGQGMVLVFAVLSVAAAVGIVYWIFFAGAAEDWLLTIALGCVTAGVFGNLYDRLGMHGLAWRVHRDPEKVGQAVYAVRDWVLFQAGDRFTWPNFNIADSLLVCGAALLVWHAYGPLVRQWFGSSPSEAAAQNKKSPSV